MSKSETTVARKNSLSLHEEETLMEILILSVYFCLMYCLMSLCTTQFIDPYGLYIFLIYSSPYSQYYIEQVAVLYVLEICRSVTVPCSSLSGHQPSSHALQVNSSWTYSLSLQAVQIQQQLASPFRITWRDTQQN